MSSPPEHIYVRPLTPQDARACESLQKSTLRREDECPHEKLLSHLGVASAFTLGVFTTAPSSEEPHELMLGYIIATKTFYPLQEDSVYKHDEAGDTLAMQAFLVSPECSGKGHGGLLVRAWIGRMRDAKVSRRVVVLVADGDDEASKWWNGFGFVDWGEKVMSRHQLVADL